MEELLKKGLQYCLSNPSEFARAYKLVYKEEICSYCPGKIEAKFNEINNNIDKMKTTQQRKYRMIPGKLIDTTMGSTQPWGQFTDKNLTDEIAEQLIAKGYGPKYFVGSPKLEVKEEVLPPVSKEEIKIEVFVKEEEKKEPVSEVNNSLGTYSRKRLTKLCVKRSYPKNEWEKLERKELIEYINNK